MNEKVIFSIQNLSKIVPPSKKILDAVSLSFYYGAKIGIIGMNGSGKSTLLKIIAGLEENFDGELMRDKNLRFGYLPQEPELDASISIVENIKVGLKEVTDKLDTFNKLSDKLGEDLSEKEMERSLHQLGEIQEYLDKKKAWDIDRQIEVMMNGLHVPDNSIAVKHLSGGERRRVSLCRLLIETPDVLLLDEPTNHLDAESVEWLEGFLKNFPGTVLAITHDRYFLDNVAEWILELFQGKGFPYKGNYRTFLQQKEQRLDKEEKGHSKQQRALKQELEWIRSSTRGRQKKNKARIAAYENLLGAVTRKQVQETEICIPQAPRLGEKVIELQNIFKGYTNLKLIEDFSIIIPRGAIIGIIGANGKGKTTLFKLITGEEAPDSGKVSLGDTVNLAHVGQFRDSLDGEKTVWEAISEEQEEINLGGVSIHSRAYVGSFNFKHAEQQKKVKTLSGGERNRVHLARLLRGGGNVLLLDEPTNDLDVSTLRSLEEALLNFAGCILVISHDRYFLDRVSTHLISYEENGELVFYHGNYSEYEEWKQGQASISETSKPS